MTISTKDIIVEYSIILASPPKSDLEGIALYVNKGLTAYRVTG